MRRPHDNDYSILGGDTGNTGKFDFDPGTLGRNHRRRACSGLAGCTETDGHSRPDPAATSVYYDRLTRLYRNGLGFGERWRLPRAGRLSGGVGSRGKWLQASGDGRYFFI